jgi:hypothetical protein
MSLYQTNKFHHNNNTNSQIKINDFFDQKTK